MDWLKDRTLVEDRIEKCKKLSSFASELGTSMAKLSIAWCAKNPNVSTVILGASKVSQLEETFCSAMLHKKDAAAIGASFETVFFVLS